MEKDQDLIELVETAEWFVTKQSFPLRKKVNSRNLEDYFAVSWGQTHKYSTTESSRKDLKHNP